MSRRVWGRLAVALVAGLAVGFGLANLVTSGGEPVIRNAQLEVGDRAPEFRLPDHTGGMPG